jgi:AcrR family transcriptional regulator
MPTSALIVAHPGHELRVFHWMEQVGPLYCCITEGSGGAAASRMTSTDRVLARAGATTGPVHGRFTDKEIYRLLLDNRLDVFVGLAHELADALIAAGVEHVAGDAVEGFNPTHDVCRFVIDGAVAIVRERTGREIRNEEFVLDTRPDSCPDAVRAAATWIRLDDAALERKLDVARQYPELRDEVDAALARYGRQAFATECLRPATTASMLEGFEGERPGYERFGEQRVREGRYDEVIRYHQHVLPVQQAIEADVRAIRAPRLEYLSPNL